MRARGPSRRAPVAPEEATVGVKALRAAFAVAAARELDLDDLAERHGLRTADLDDPDHRYSHVAWTDLWDDIERLSGDPGIGLHAAAALPMGHWDVIDYLIASSETVGDGLKKLARYFPLISTAVDHVLCEDADGVRLVRRHRPGVTRSRPASELVIASIVFRFRKLASSSWAPKHITFAHAPSVPKEEYWLVWGQKRVVLPSAIAAFVTGGFLVAYAIRDSYGGSMRLSSGIEHTVFGLNIGVVGFIAVNLLSALALALRARKRTKDTSGRAARLGERTIRSSPKHRQAADCGKVAPGSLVDESPALRRALPSRIAHHGHTNRC